MAKVHPTLGPIGLRAVLLRIHTDLLKIHNRVDSWAEYRSVELSNLEKMVIVLEDRRFINHLGVDVISCVREIAKAITFRRHGGASTVDMQFVRTATGFRRKTLGRKLYEILLALIIQYRYSKLMILRSYIDCAFFGSHLIGAKRAARHVFGKYPHELDLKEAAQLAAMLVYPRPLSEDAIWKHRVNRRANYGVSVYIANKKRFDKIPG